MSISYDHCHTGTYLDTDRECIQPIGDISFCPELRGYIRVNQQPEYTRMGFTNRE